MTGELLSLETAGKLVKYNKVIEYIKKDIEDIKEYDTDRKIYTGEAVIDMLKVLLDVLEG